MKAHVWDWGNWIGVRDSTGQEIRVGDTIMYPPSVWGSSESNKAVVSYDVETASFVAIGKPSEWPEFATIIKKWND